MTKHRLTLLFSLLFATGFFVLSCSHVEMKPLSHLGTPRYHTRTGIELMNRGKYDDAQREFSLALRLNPEYSMAYAGDGLISAYRGDFANAMDLMEKAQKYAKKKEEKIFTHIGKIRLYTMGRRENDWLDLSEEQFGRAVGLDNKSSSAYYFMGMAYKLGLEFDKAGRMFAKVLDLGAEYVEEADKEWKLIRKIHKATPKTTAGKKIAIVTGITRADAAALFVEELKINELYEKKGISNVLSDDSGKTEKERKPSVSAADIAGSPFENDIEIVLNTGINGLGLYPDNTFRPDELVTRASCAVMIDDVLKKIAENGETHVNSITNRSSFTDMKNDLPYFDAVMAVTGRGLMHAENFTTGEFSPSSPISGVDALLIIKNLKEELRYF